MSCLALVGSFVFVGYEFKVSKYRIDNPKLVGQVAVPKRVSQLVANKSDVLFCFCFLEGSCFMLSKDLQLLRSFELKIRYSDLRNELSVALCKANGSFVYIKANGMLACLDTDKMEESVLVAEPVEGRQE